MSIMTVLWLILGILVFAVIIVGLMAFIDWRAFFVRRFGSNYKKGLAHINLDGAWLYRESNLFYEGDLAITYTRREKDGSRSDDIVPHAIGFDYDEYSGARVYRVMPGGSIGFSDTHAGPVSDFPAALISAHVLGQTAEKLSTSVNSEEPGFNFKPYILVALGIILILAGLFLTGVIKLPSAPLQTETPAAAPAPGTVPKIIEVD